MAQHFRRQAVCVLVLLLAASALGRRQPLLSGEPLLNSSTDCTPQQVHIGLGKTNTELHVSWKTAGSSCRSEVSVCDASGGAETSTVGYNFLISQKDMCSAPAADNAFALQLHRVHLRGLAPGRTYTYRVAGSDREGTFTASPEVGPQQKMSFAAFGDLGDPVHERAKSPGAAATIRTLKRDVEDMDLILHVGDISYANGDPAIWDSFMDSIEPLASRVPYMVAVGNHEYDYLKGDTVNDPSGAKPYDPSWGNYGEDSGGECGVMTARRFYTPARHRADNPPFWYGFDYGSVHFTVISTEHDLTPGSRQHDWLEQELAGVDRCATPWLILLLHRPMYVVYPHKSNRDVGEHFQASFEDLLQLYRVDATIAGHVHSYYRSCPVYNYACTDEDYYAPPPQSAAAGSAAEAAAATVAAGERGAGAGGNSASTAQAASGSSNRRPRIDTGGIDRDNHGTVHFVLGSAGHKLSYVERGQEEWCQEAFVTWGYGRFTVEGPDRLKMEFVESETGEVLDQVTVHASPFRQQQCRGGSSSSSGNGRPASS